MEGTEAHNPQEGNKMPTLETKESREKHLAGLICQALVGTATTATVADLRGGISRLAEMARNGDESVLKVIQLKKGPAYPKPDELAICDIVTIDTTRGPRTGSLIYWNSKTGAVKIVTDDGRGFSGRYVP